MVASVACTFVFSSSTSQAGVQSHPKAQRTPFIVSTKKIFRAKPSAWRAGAPAVKSLSAQELPLLVEIWLAGVLFLQDAPNRRQPHLFSSGLPGGGASISVESRAPGKVAPRETPVGVIGHRGPHHAAICRLAVARRAMPSSAGPFPSDILPVRALTGLTEDSNSKQSSRTSSRKFAGFDFLRQSFSRSSWESLIFFIRRFWWLNKARAASKTGKTAATTVAVATPARKSLRLRCDALTNHWKELARPRRPLASGQTAARLWPLASLSHSWSPHQTQRKIRTGRGLGRRISLLTLGSHRRPLPCSNGVAHSCPAGRHASEKKVFSLRQRRGRFPCPKRENPNASCKGRGTNGNVSGDARSRNGEWAAPGSNAPATSAFPTATASAANRRKNNPSSNPLT